MKTKLGDPDCPDILPYTHLKPTTETDPAVQRGLEIAGSLTAGALGGYIFYWITRLIAKYGFLGEISGAAIRPLPYLLSGVISAALVETARLAHDISLHILGDRKEYQDELPAESTPFDRLRQHSWKIIGHLEKAQEDVDAVFSRLFDVRSAKFLRENCIQDKDLYFVEIARRAFWEQIHETMITAVPQELGVYLVEAAGYMIIGGHLFVWLHGISFLNGILQKVTEIYRKVDLQAREYAKEVKLQNAMFDGLLDYEVSCKKKTKNHHLEPTQTKEKAIGIENPLDTEKEKVEISAT